MKPLKTKLAGFSLALLMTAAVKGQPVTVYQNNFDDGTNSLLGFTDFGQFSSTAQVANGQLELFNAWGASRGGVSLNTSALTGYSNTLSANSGKVEWALKISNTDGQFNNSFFFVPASNNADPYSLAQGYAFRGGGMVGNRMYLSHFDLMVNGPETILIDVPDALGLGTLPEMGSVRITFEPFSSRWSVYMDRGLSYTDPKTATNLLGTAVDGTYTHVPLTYMSMGGEESGTEYFDNVSITIVPETAFGQTNVLLPGDPIIASSTNSTLSEGAANAIDGTIASYVNFDSANDARPSGFVVTPSVGNTLVRGIGMESADNAPDRDPKEVMLEGSNDDTISSFKSGNWALIVDLLSIPSWESVFGPVTNRYQTETFLFDNTNSYRHYRWTVLHTQGPSSCCMQIAEVQLYGVSLLISQTISFSLPTQVMLTNTPITLSATASTGLPVTFSVLSGPATLNLDQLFLTGVGQVTIRAEQAGNSQYQAVSVDQTFNVTPAGGVNEPPSVTTPTNVVDMNWNSSVSIPYYITAPDSTWDLTNIVVTSAFPLVVPNTLTNIVVTGSPVTPGTTGTVMVTVTPAPNTSGSGTLIFILTGGYNPVTNILTLNEHVPGLSILSQPQSTFAELGSDATFTVVANGTLPITYQWQFMGTNLPGETKPSLTLTNVQPSQSGPYAVIIGNGNETLASVPAVLSVAGVAGLGVLAGPIVNPANGRHYFLLEATTWTNAEAAAVGMGGHLATIDSPEDNSWVYNTFGNFNGSSRDLWIGLYDPTPSAMLDFPNLKWTSLLWISGYPAHFEDWSSAPRPEWNTNGLSWRVYKICGPANPRTPGSIVNDSPSASLNAVIELPLPLEIVFQPQTVSVGIGSDASLSVLADGFAPIYYQWQSNGTNLPGETQTTLTLTNAKPDQSGLYSLVISNMSGTLTSGPIFLSVAGIVGWGSSIFGGDTRTNISPGLTSVRAIVGGLMHDLALKADGTVVAWGDNSYNQLSVPADLTNAVALAGAEYHSLALRADGTVVAWGYNLRAWVPEGLSNVVAIAAAGYNNLALKNDGTVVAWGGDGASPSIVPSGLSNVVGIATASGRDLALKADATVVAWDDTTAVMIEIPSSLTNVVAIAAGEYQNLALKGDGSVIAFKTWHNQNDTVSGGLTNVAAITAGATHCLALKANGSVVAWGDNTGGG